MVMGKKSYLFCRDLDACRRAAMMYSLFGACKVLGKNPERWLSYVLKNIQTTPKDKLYTLLPCLKKGNDNAAVQSYCFI